MNERRKRERKCECTGGVGGKSDGAPESKRAMMMLVVAESMAHLKEG